MVEILDETAQFPAPERLRAAVQRLLDEVELGDRDVTIVLIGDEAMRERNRADRGIDEPTDVLSYPTHEPDDDGFPAVPHLGDILIDVDQARRQAPDHGLGPLDEVLVLAAHGLTHLRGYDHVDDEAWIPFHQAQRAVLRDADA